MRIIRVFPHRNTYTPADDLAVIGPPPFSELIPPHDEVHISCTFSWDKEYCLFLLDQWRAATNKAVRIGGFAFSSPAADFVRGLYIKPNIVFTSRGCKNECAWCRVWRVEGDLRELPVTAGNWIQDNNFLQCTRSHKDKVFSMLKSQKGICFMGGLQVDLIDDHFISAIQSLWISKLFIACDSESAIPPMEKAVSKLSKAGFKRDNIQCYALIGDDMSKNEERLLKIYHAGATPRAQLYRPYSDTKKKYPKEWNQFCKKWCRPALTKKYVQGGCEKRAPLTGAFSYGLYEDHQYQSAAPPETSG